MTLLFLWSAFAADDAVQVHEVIHCRLLCAELIIRVLLDAIDIDISHVDIYDLAEKLHELSGVR